MLKYKNTRTVEVHDWDKLVQDTYGKPYSFQQQDGCKQRGTFTLTIPEKFGDDEDDEMNDEIPEIINGNEMGVKFNVWLKRDPNSPLNPTKKQLEGSAYYWGKNEEDAKEYKESKSHLDLFWTRNFYPSIEKLANDLHSKGLIEEGEYVINIDW